MALVGTNGIGEFTPVGNGRIFGDGLEPRGGEIWLSNLIALAQPLGVNERLVRTSVYRLAQENWLERTASGRRSYYGLTDAGQRQL